jgi:transcriptional regulator with XRE-family HTH domain
VRVEELIGFRIRQARSDAGMSLEEFGRLLGEPLGKAWVKQSVHNAENGRRLFTAAELVAVALVLRCTVADLFRLPSDVDALTLPNATVTREQLNRWAELETPSVADLRRALHSMQASIRRVAEAGASLDQDAQRVFDELESVLTRLSPESE